MDPKSCGEKVSVSAAAAPGGASGPVAVPAFAAASGSGRVVASTTAVVTNAIPAPQRPALVPVVLALTGDGVLHDHLAELATAHGHGFHCTSDAGEASRVLHAAGPAVVVVVDVDVPGGGRLVRAVHGDHWWRDVPVLAVTATNNPMISVTLDVPVFFKPSVDGLAEALVACMSPAPQAARLAGAAADLAAAWTASVPAPRLRS